MYLSPSAVSTLLRQLQVILRYKDISLFLKAQRKGRKKWAFLTVFKVF